MTGYEETMMYTANEIRFENKMKEYEVKQNELQM